MDITIALDAMGGDYGPSVVVPAAVAALGARSELRITLVGDETDLQEHLKKYSHAIKDRISVQHTSQKVEMNERPSAALRYKKDSSMRVAINLVKEGAAQACVSAGNTGALMATARFVLKTLPGIDRPAITTTLPSSIPNKAVRVLDLGANLDVGAATLFQFAVMGSVLAQATDRVEHPKIALLNVGEEEIKGNEQVKETAILLNEHQDLNYIGFVEGNDIFKAVADVVVCDGFVGNVALKASEGTSRLVTHYLKMAFNASLYGRIMKFLVGPLLRNVRDKIDPSSYNGASLVGLQGIVVKSHGSASSRAYANAIEEACLQVEHDVPQRIKNKVMHILQS